jgi:subfamily B ATP-binding cassette protein HlyB/CyaB
MQAVEAGTEEVGLFWAADNGVMSLVLALQLLGLSVDLGHLGHQFASKGSVKILDLLRLARALGLRARVLESTYERMKEIAFPVIARHENGRFFIVTGLVEQPDGASKVVVHDAQAAHAIVITRDQLLQIWTGHLLLIAKRFRPSEIARRWLEIAGLVSDSSRPDLRLRR